MTLYWVRGDNITHKGHHPCKILVNIWSQLCSQAISLSSVQEEGRVLWYFLLCMIPSSCCLARVWGWPSSVGCRLSRLGDAEVAMKAS